METRAKKGDLSVTALYTSQTWAWGGLPCAHLFETPEAKKVFDATNAALAVASVFKRGLAPLRHSLLHRHTMIDKLLADAHATQVLELASGLSRRGASVTIDRVPRYTEIDLPPVISRKKELLGRTEEGRAVLARQSFHLVGDDVETAALEAHVTKGEPLFVIAEGLLMYLSPEAQRRLWDRVVRLFAIAEKATFVFDLVPACEQPKPGAVGRTLESMMKRFTGGRSFERDARTRDDVAGELRAAGFPHVSTLEPAEVAHAWGLPFPDAKTQQLLFVCRSA